jgi:hypothetical protein
VNGPSGPPGDGTGDDAARGGNGRRDGRDNGGTPPHGVPVPRVPPPRDPVEDGPLGPAPVPPEPVPPEPVAPRRSGRDEAYERAATPGYDHSTLKSLLGAWALAACSPEETLAVERHLTDCAACADEAVRLRDAVQLLEPYDPLDLDPALRARVLRTCLGRRPARVPVPEWSSPYDAETARLDALLRSLGAQDWFEPVTLRWHSGSHVTSVARVIEHLTAVDGLIAVALGLTEPLGADPGAPSEPRARTEEYWRRFPERPARDVHDTWREQGGSLLRTVSFAGDSAGGLDVSYGPQAALPLRDAFLDRAFECWIHADDIAGAVDYPYDPPAPRHLHRMIDLAARLLPGALAVRRRNGLADPPTGLVEAGAPGRSLCLEVEGAGGGEWFIPLDSPGAAASEEHSVAHIALESLAFCKLAAGHLSPQELATGQEGDRGAIRDVLFAAASLSRL